MNVCLLLCILLPVSVTSVDVQRVVVYLESTHTFDIDSTVEYIIEFIPLAEQAQWAAARLRLAAAGGGAADPARPLLLTARQPAGAQTWQLPYWSESGRQLLTSMERTLCFNFDAAAEESPRALVSLHVSSGGNGSAAARVSVRAEPVRDAPLQFDVPHTLTATQTAPRVHYYKWEGEQSSARLVVTSEDDLCALVSVHNFSCPVLETRETASRDGFRMSMLRQGAIFVARRLFPDGFYVTTLVLDSDDLCTGQGAAAEADWLWEAALGAAAPLDTREHAVDRNKTFTLTVRGTLSRGQYLAATSALVGLSLVLYAGFAGAVLAQRLPAVRRAVGPRAVLQPTPTPAPAEEGGDSNDANRSRRRRDSDATLDSMEDDSESDEDPPESASPRAAPPARAPGPPAAVTDADQQPSPSADAVPPSGARNGIQPSNHTTESQGRGGVGGGGLAGLGGGGLAGLARRRAGVLRARSDRYLHALYTVAVFYALPVLQFVAAFQIILNVSGSLDLCYYNFLCAHPLGQLSDFNHVASNLPYLLLGALFMLQVRRRRWRRARKPRHEEYGIPAHYGLLSALGAGMMVVALLSASYHVCPNRLNFQFDTAFMYVLCVLTMVKIYQARHPDITARAHSAFAALAGLIAFVVWGVLGGGALFWAGWSVLHVFGALLLSLRVYYLGQFTLDAAGVSEAARGLGWGARGALGGRAPLHVPRLLLLLAANALNWGFAIYGLVVMPSNFASHLLFVLLSNALLQLLAYLCLKLWHGERPRAHAWLMLAAAGATWPPALYFFVLGSSAWSTTPARSRLLNHECRVLDFYDAHDLWHALSAVALYFTFNVMLTWDDGLSAVKRTDIPVF